jgi:dipeptidyl aminopeptidase/acylaminoacyl peptidase
MARRFRHLPVAALLVAAVLFQPNAGRAEMPSGTPLPLVGLFDMVVDPFHSHVFVTGSPPYPEFNPRVVVLDFDGNIVTTIEDQPGASGMYLDDATGTMYVVLREISAISEIDTATLVETGRVSLGSNAPNPGFVAGAGGLIWFGFGEWPDQVGIGSMDPESNEVRIYPRFSHPDNPLLASTAATPELLIAGESGIGNALAEFRILPDGGPRLVGVNKYPADSANMQELTITPDGEQLLMASGYPYYVAAFSIRHLHEVGEYATGPYPTAVDVSPDGRYVAAGASAVSDPDVFFFRTGHSNPIKSFDISPGNEAVTNRGVGFSPTMDRLFVTTMEVGYDGSPVFRILTLP